jgi:sugar/nucleoside kinase (ribokinase family)
MVWDTIRRDTDVGSPVEEWGGITYALAAADAINPFDFKVRPIIKLGRDLAARGVQFLAGLSVIETDAAVAIVDEPNPRVELSYRGEVRRCERLRGGVPPWTWVELEARIRGCDALYVNFITGSEFDLPSAQMLSRCFAGPIYADVHSLTLGTGPQGERYRRQLERWPEWLRCFDAVQINEDELRALSTLWGDPWSFAAAVVGRETPLLFVTLGASGAAYFAASDALPLGGARHRQWRGHGPVRTGKVPVAPMSGGDPTGCGDVWGVTACAALLGGADVEEAVRRANAAASRNVSHRGASGLNRFLRGEIERV